MGNRGERTRVDLIEDYRFLGKFVQAGSANPFVTVAAEEVPTESI